ncbi:hypothetical protein HPB48_013929 [Haemaphysalis longicornis]|uniref:Uncharacterized protein n=1 Tax=Haemaphysalis longicornis TaxID=44386 RepID=A0A9J6GUA2_HAELO|nr:hypothetical protein HPB48_013929 [Haemaphysalis longicornis]
MLLLLSGDVESNPGPGTVPSGPTVDSIFEIVQSLEAKHEHVLREIKELKDNQVAISTSMEDILNRVTVVERNAVLRKSEVHTILAEHNVPSCLDRDVASLKTQVEDTNNRLRRNNLIIYGLTDSLNESWAQSEVKALCFFDKQLGEPIAPDRIERAHPLGIFRENKNRPIIVKFSSYKDRERMLSREHKLKNTNFALREDLTPAAKFAQSKLLQFSRSSGSSYKLRHNKLIVNEKSFIYDNILDLVVEPKR